MSATPHIAAPLAAALLVPADPLRPGRPDPHFSRDARAARDRDVPVVRLDHDALLRGAADEAVRAVPRGTGPLLYRGWMIPAPRYAALEAALRARDVALVTPHLRYRAAHELAGWYPLFRDLTPATVFLPAGRAGGPEAEHVLSTLPRLLPGVRAAIVKDQVKSRKHEWDHACFLPDITDTAHVVTVVRAFLDGQGDDLQGDLAFRAFEDFTGPEVRVWWAGAEPVLTTPHPDTPPEHIPPATAAPVGPVVSPALREAVAALGSPLCTTDLALRRDGGTRVVEVGDGQVSDLPPAFEAGPLLHRLFTAAG